MKTSLRALATRKPLHLPFWVISGRAHFGFCTICGARTLFAKYQAWLRDHYHCVRSWSIPRHRALVKVLRERFPQLSSLSVHESSPGSVSSNWIARNAGGYLPTHYFPEITPGSYKWNFRCENLEKQTFADEQFDLVISQDVMEHVLDPASAFQEISRTLKPGGAHVFTVPIYKNKPTLIRARHSESGIEHLERPDYHGNPIDKSGSLVVTEWGEDTIDFIGNACGLKTEKLSFNDRKLGLVAEFLDVLISTKPDGES